MARTAADLYPAMTADLTRFARRLPALAGSLAIHGILIAGLGLLVARSHAPVFAPLDQEAWVLYEEPRDTEYPGPWAEHTPKPVPAAEFFDPDLAPPLAWEGAEVPEPDLELSFPEPLVWRPDILAGLAGVLGNEEAAARGLPPWWGTLIP